MLPLQTLLIFFGGLFLGLILGLRLSMSSYAVAGNQVAPTRVAATYPGVQQQADGLELRRMRTELDRLEGVRRDLQNATRQLDALAASKSHCNTEADKDSGANSTCQLRCDKDCDAFAENCQGEAWVCINLYELMKGTNRPRGTYFLNQQVAEGPYFWDSQCFGRLMQTAREEVRTIIRMHVEQAASTLGGYGAIDETMPLARYIGRDFFSYGRNAEVKRSFQLAIEQAFARQYHYGPRRLRPTELPEAVQSNQSAAVLLDAIDPKDRVCQPNGIPLVQLARERTFNRQWATFNTKDNLHEDALFFMMDLLFEQKHMFHYQKWLGVTLQQDPFDAIVIQRVLHEIKPDLVVETGTHMGGGALFLASVLSLVRPEAQVITCDPWKGLVRDSLSKYDASARRLWDRYVQFHGNLSTWPPLVKHIRSAAAAASVTMVLLDSDHQADNVAAELNAYADIVSVGSYLVVEDTKMERLFKTRGLHTWRSPVSALDAFLAVNAGIFVVDRAAEPYGFSQHPRGFLRRVSSQPVRKVSCRGPEHLQPWCDRA